MLRESLGRNNIFFLGSSKKLVKYVKFCFEINSEYLKFIAKKETLWEILYAYVQRTAPTTLRV